MGLPRRRLAVLVNEPDNRVLECAVAGHADIIVTRDPAMLNLKTYGHIGVGSLRQFLDETADSGPVSGGCITAKDVQGAAKSDP